MGPPGVKHATSALRELSSIGGMRTAPEREDYSESNYDEWSGYGGSLFAQRPQGGTNAYLAVDDTEDVEAD